MRADPEKARLAAEALARARADAWARGERPGRRGVVGPPAGGQRGAAQAPLSGVEGGGSPLGGTAWSARTRRDDPQPLNVAVGGMLSARGWRSRAAVAAVFGRWGEIVGEQVAAHVHPEAFEEGELVVLADSPAWATQMRLLAPQVLRRLGQELGVGTVRHVRVRTPGGGPGGRRPSRRG